MRHGKKYFLLLCLFYFFYLISSPRAYSAELQGEFYPARVKDISDRAYEAAVIELLDGAEESIVMSMYIFKAGGKGPIGFLMRDLEEALERGVSVEVYLNSRLDSRDPERTFSEEPFEGLKEKGANIYVATSNYRLHDKLIIVDRRYVVEGSMNWSISAIRTNYESAVLIDSPELAKTKLIRVKRIALEGEEDNSERPDRTRGLEPLPEGSVVSISVNLLEDKDLFPAMLTRHADRAMDTYLLLLAEATRLKKKEFFISLEDMAACLKMPSGWNETTARRQVIKVLRELKNRYELIDIDFSYGKDAWIKIKDVPGDEFEIKGEFFNPEFLASKSQPAKFILLVKTLLEKEGKTLNSVTNREICDRFYISENTVIKGSKEIR